MDLYIRPRHPGMAPPALPPRQPRKEPHQFQEPPAPRTFVHWAVAICPFVGGDSRSFDH